MKSVLIVGMGRFGKALAEKMFDMGNDVMVVDINKDKVELVADRCTRAVIGDCTKPAVINNLGVSNYDICFVTIGENLQSALEITSNMKELGAKHIICKASNEIHKKFLLMAGADEVILPETEVAKNLAVRCSGNNIFECIELTEDYSIFELPVHSSWVGKSIMQIDVRRKHALNILGIKQGEEIMMMPSGDYVFAVGDHVMVMGKPADAIKLSNKN